MCSTFIMCVATGSPGIQCRGVAERSNRGRRARSGVSVREITEVLLMPVVGSSRSADSVPSSTAKADYASRIQP